MSEQSTPVPEDPRQHAEAAAEGETTKDAGTETVREHASDPAEGA